MNQTLSELIKNKRIQMCLSQSDFAKQCKITKLSVINIETGKVKNLRFKTIRDISNSTNIPTDEIQKAIKNTID